MKTILFAPSENENLTTLSRKRNVLEEAFEVLPEMLISDLKIIKNTVLLLKEDYPALNIAIIALNDSKVHSRLAEGAIN